jgi:hypothetical protein
MQQAAIVIRKHPEGFHYVPWDEDPHPIREQLKAHIFQHLAETGHTTAVMSGGHIRLLSGPLSHLGR